MEWALPIYATWGSLSSATWDGSMRKIAATVRGLLLRDRGAKMDCDPESE